MSHADRVREAERRVLKNAEIFGDSTEHGIVARAVAKGYLADAVAQLKALRAATCATCEGRGECWDDETGAYKCPAKCGNGRART